MSGIFRPREQRNITCLASRLPFLHIHRRILAMSHESVRWMQAFAASTISLSQANVWQPLVDVYRTGNGWLIKYELAGVRPEDVSLSVNGACLTLHGVRRDCCIEEGCCHYRMEISYSHFERTVELPVDFEGARLTSEFRHGMLLVRVEKEGCQ